MGSANSFEANVLHGRYWGFLIPLFATIALAQFDLTDQSQKLRPRAGRWLERVSAVVWLGAIMAFGALVSPVFAIYPWGFPDLFALYRPANAAWIYTTPVPYSFAIAIALLSACALAYLVALPARRFLYAASLAVVFALGNINTTGWQFSIMPDIRPLVEAGQAATRIVGRQSEGLFVAAEYWGRTPYVSFQLPLRSHIAIKPEKTVLTEADVPAGAKWVLTAAPYGVEFSHTLAIPLASLTLYLRGAHASE
jgi:hypothetical protein